MTRTIEGVLEWAKKNPLYTYKDGAGRKKSWAGLCEAFVNNAGDFSQSFDSALLAGDASGWLNPNWKTAPIGAIHYWAGVGGDGHVAFELGGGTLLMASSRVSNIGTALGTIHFTDYGLPLYRGWAMKHGDETLATTTTAGNGGKPLEIDMPLSEADLTNIAQHVWVHSLVGVAGASRGVKGRAADWLLNMSDSVGAILAKPSTVVDPVKLAAELTKAGLSVTIDAKAVAAAIDASLRDDFAAIPAAVRSAIVK